MYKWIARKLDYYNATLTHLGYGWTFEEVPLLLDVMALKSVMDDDRNKETYWGWTFEEWIDYLETYEENKV